MLLWPYCISFQLLDHCTFPRLPWAAVVHRGEWAVPLWLLCWSRAGYAASGREAQWCILHFLNVLIGKDYAWFCEMCRMIIWATAVTFKASFKLQSLSGFVRILWPTSLIKTKRHAPWGIAGCEKTEDVIFPFFFFMYYTRFDLQSQPACVALAITWLEHFFQGFLTKNAQFASLMFDPVMTEIWIYSQNWMSHKMSSELCLLFNQATRSPLKILSASTKYSDESVSQPFSSQGTSVL